MTNVWKPIALVGIFLAYTYGIHLLGFSKGSADVQRIWDLSEEKKKNAIGELQTKYAELEGEHKRITSEITDDLQRAKEAYSAALISEQLRFDRRLQQSETRANLYQRKAQGSDIERRNLAEHAAQLDRSLEEGRRLVTELSETIRLRDREITSLAQVIANDRKLLE